MKKHLLRIIFVGFCSVIIILGILLYFRVIWFVYPNKSIYSVYGLDVSNHQGKINWENVDKKYNFVFVKATEGDDFVDKRFPENAAGVKGTNRILGAYHFFHFNYDGIAQADNFIITAGDIIDLPPVVDFEFAGNSGRYDKDEILKELKDCINRLEDYYQHSVIIYTTRSAYGEYIKDNFSNPIWYRSIFSPIDKNVENVLFWQYHNSAKIKGIDTIVDLNVFKGKKEELNSLVMKK
jgi:lysozyme